MRREAHYAQWKVPGLKAESGAAPTHLILEDLVRVFFEQADGRVARVEEGAVAVDRSDLRKFRGGVSKRRVARLVESLGRLPAAWRGDAAFGMLATLSLIHI